MRLMNLFLVVKNEDGCDKVPIMLNPDNVSFVEDALPIKWCPDPCVAVSLNIDNATELRIKGTMNDFAVEWQQAKWSSR